MGNRLYIGNLSFTATETDLMDLFGQAGAVKEISLIQDRFTGKSRGFAFVTMMTDDDAANAISLFHGKSIGGRPLTVNEARPREERPSGFRAGGGSGGGFRERSGGDDRGGHRSGGGGGGRGDRDKDRGNRGGGGGYGGDFEGHEDH